MQDRFHPNPDLKITVMDNNNSKPTRSDLQNAFVIDNFLSSSECDHYIKETENLGYKSLEEDYPKEYRDASRVVLLERTMFLSKKND